MLESMVRRLRPHPKHVWWVVLASVFGTEFLLMLALPLIVPSATPRWIESTLDAIVLTLILAPLLWLTVLRPLVEVGRLRDRFLQELFSRIEIERRWIAQELHDSVGQSLTLLVSGIRSAEEVVTVPDVGDKFHSLRDLAQMTLKDVKRLTLGLRPSLLDDLGLAPAIERIASDIQNTGEVCVMVDVASIAGKRFDGHLETAVFRIVQEALTNVVKHSKALKASVSIRHGVSIMEVVVEDDGCGVDLDELARMTPTAGHLGLVGMRERTTLLGGEFRIECLATGGTRVSATFPVGELAT